MSGGGEGVVGAAVPAEVGGVVGVAPSLALPPDEEPSLLRFELPGCRPFIAADPDASDNSQIGVTVYELALDSA